MKQSDTEIFGADQVNWAGICSIPLAYFLAHHVLVNYMPIEIFTALAVAFVVYPLLRIYVFKPGR